MDDNSINSPEVEAPVVDSGQKFLKQIYTFRCIDAKAMTSSKGNKMVQLQWEVIFPETQRLEAGIFQTAGLQTTNYMMLEGTSVTNSRKFTKKVGKPWPIDYDTFDKSEYIGVMVKNIGQSRLKEKMGEEYDETTGKVKVVKLLDDEGKPISSWQFEMASLGDDALRVYNGDAPAF